MIKGKEELKKYYNKEKIVETYESKRFHNTYKKLQHKIELDLINKYVSTFKKPKLLEIAVGTGRVTRDMKAKGIGVDTSENMLKTAKKNAPGWKFIRMDVMNLKFKEKKDIVVSLRLIRHFNKADRKKAYRNIHDILSKKSIFIFDMPTGRHNKVLQLIDLFKNQDKIYEADMSLKDIRKELKESGFDIIKVYNTKYEGLLFRSMCIMNDLFNGLYTLLKRKMERNMNKLNIASNILLIVKPKW